MWYIEEFFSEEEKFSVEAILDDDGWNGVGNSVELIIDYFTFQEVPTGFQAVDVVQDLRALLQAFDSSDSHLFQGLTEY